MGNVHSIMVGHTQVRKAATLNLRQGPLGQLELTHRHFGHAQDHHIALRHRKTSADPLHGQEDKLVDEYRDLFEQARKGELAAAGMTRLRAVEGQLREIAATREAEAQGVAGAGPDDLEKHRDAQGSTEHHAPGYSSPMPAYRGPRRPEEGRYAQGIPEDEKASWRRDIEEAKRQPGSKEDKLMAPTTPGEVMRNTGAMAWADPDERLTGGYDISRVVPVDDDIQTETPDADILGDLPDGDLAYAAEPDRVLKQRSSVAYFNRGGDGVSVGWGQQRPIIVKNAPADHQEPERALLVELIAREQAEQRAGEDESTDIAMIQEMLDMQKGPV